MNDPRDLLAEHWGLTAPRVRSLDGGMNSTTWLVEHDGTAYVAKHVPPGGVDALLAGSEVARTLADAGFTTGRPVAARDGRLVVTEAGLALLEHVPGRELEGDSEDEQEWIARVLAGVHATDAAPGPATSVFATDWLDPHAPGVGEHDWLVTAIAHVREETDPLALTWSVLHTDPAPEAFVHDDATGVTGLIDWAGARRGPVLYDVASAVMYLGGRARASAFLAAYADRGPLAADELRQLDAFSRLREAVQGVYFAGRLATDDRTGGVEVADNQRGLDDARRRLAGLG
ncbi:homoserine kinase type II [Nocardioides exalbidus]|uniref:Homoserine kinase type II n=1 Tax=Nocardioides exalbidus TaxID=402596 RepID=A0A1H4TZZ6_9ACTN|nr:phosphotransferase [Nocardioides exalbidus]SEC61778.1 homoserine kinase type II [Nocardioides exalbidus]